MGEVTFIILLVALVVDWFIGEPEVLWSRFPHPVILFGKAVSLLDKRLNNPDLSSGTLVRRGAIAITCLILAALLVGTALQIGIAALGPVGLLLEVFLVFVLLAQKSLKDHVLAVADGLRTDGLAGGRKAVSMIVGRDPEQLDESGVSRAAIESLAENFSDGVVAPAFWYAVFGLPGLLVYKMINTADSMIAYKNEKYLHFGRTAAEVDDLANWLPARLSAFLIGSGAIAIGGIQAARDALVVSFRDHGLHRSPNAGWPEAAMAGAANLALGGPRDYGHEFVSQAYLNSSGRQALNAADIQKSVRFFDAACFALWALVIVLIVVG